MKGMYMLSPNAVQASLTACELSLRADTTGALAAGSDCSGRGSRREQAHAKCYGCGCCYGGQALVEPTFHNHTLVEPLWVGRRRQALGRRGQAHAECQGYGCCYCGQVLEN